MFSEIVKSLRVFFFNRICLKPKSKTVFRKSLRDVHNFIEGGRAGVTVFDTVMSGVGGCNWERSER